MQEDFLCVECRKKPPDWEPRAFRDLDTGELITGNRTFCSDACELVYVERMKLEYGPNQFFVSVDLKHVQ